MKNSIQVYYSPLFGDIRTKLVNGEPHFVGRDIAIALGYSKPENAIAQHVDEDDTLKQGIRSGGQTREMNIINESGMYSLIFSSQLPSAKQFKRWVTKEVLPSIRKTGYYATPHTTRNLTRPTPELIWYNNTLCLTAGWMIKAGVMGKSMYGKLVSRNQIDRVRRGCYGTPALVSYATLPARYKKRIIERYGEPTVPIDNKKLVSIIAELCKVGDDKLRLSILTKLLN